jgi:hypothetical protein
VGGASSLEQKGRQGERQHRAQLSETPKFLSAQETTMTTATLTHSAVSAPTTNITRVLRHVVTGERVLLGLCFFVCGLNGFLDFIPPPADPGPDDAMNFAMALMRAGYFFPMLKGLETLAGLMLLTKRYVPLALVLLAPILVNILSFHYFLAGSGVLFSVVLIAFALHIAWTYRAAFRPMLSAV